MNHDLAGLAEDYWQYRLRQAPTTALMLGDHRYDSDIEDLSRAAEDDHIACLEGFAAAAKAMDPAGLDADERVTRGVLAFEAASEAAATRFRAAELAVSHTQGIHLSWWTAVPQFPLLEAQHAADVVVKLGKVGAMLDQAGERLREGVAAGRVPPRIACEETVTQIDEYLAGPVAADPFLQVNPPPEFADAATAEWRDRLAAVIADDIRPGYGRYRDLIRDEILPASRPQEKSGICWLPDGEEYYAAAIYRNVTQPRTAEEIHQIGLDVIATLEDEYRELGSTVLGTADLADIYTRLRDDPDLHHTAGPDIVAQAERAMARAKAAMGGWFGRLPQADCTVNEIAYGPTAFYMPPAADGSRPGMFFINTKDPERWGRFEVEAMALHEGIPGHHLQLAISGELDHIPEFRKYARVTAFAEGWGLYTERLSDEMGLYSSDLDRMGMLALDSMRACRLVVDTGIHALGWSRRQAIDYVLAHSPMSETTVTDEIDRYIGWPGQALAYMMGRLEINRLRADAEAELGDGFDIKGFHDTVLGSGLVPLDVLGELVRAWAAGV